MTQRFASAVTDQVVYFTAAPGGTSITVERSRNGSALSSMTTPTVTDLGDGLYSLLLDEDMTIGSGNLTESMAFVVKGNGISDVIIIAELFVNHVDVQEINSSEVFGDGTVSDKWRGTA